MPSFFSLCTRALLLLSALVRSRRRSSHLMRFSLFTCNVRTMFASLVRMRCAARPQCNEILFKWLSSLRARARARTSSNADEKLTKKVEEWRRHLRRGNFRINWCRNAVLACRARLDRIRANLICTAQTLQSHAKITSNNIHGWRA